MTQAQYDGLVQLYNESAMTQITTDPKTIYHSIAFSFDGIGIPDEARLWRQGILDQLASDLASIPPVDE